MTFVSFNKISTVLVLAVIISLVFGAAMRSWAPTFGNAYAQSPTSRPPNIFVIMGDDFGFSDVGSFGSEIPTPNLDMISKEGKILTNYYTANTFLSLSDVMEF
jgi:hypothetical protein